MIFVFFLFLSACSMVSLQHSEELDSDTALNSNIHVEEKDNNQVDTENNSGENLVELYSIVLDALMEENQGLNQDINYIAIDMSNFVKLTETDKQEILNYFKEKYKIDILVATYDELIEEGFFNYDTMSFDGVLLNIEKVDFKSNKNIFFEVSKYRSAKGAIGVEITVQLEGNNWKVKEIKDIWIS